MVRQNIFFLTSKKSAAWEWIKTSPDNKYIKEKYQDLNVPCKKLAGTTWDTPFTDEFLKMFDKDWCQYLEKEHERLYGKQPDNILKFKKFDLFLKNASIKTMSLNSQAFANRKYKWISVPPFLNGMNYTQTIGGSFAQMELTAKQDCTVYIATSLIRDDWQQIKGMLRCNNADHSSLNLYKVDVKTGQRLAVPQKGTDHAGSLLFFKD